VHARIRGPLNMSKLFISHSPKDDVFARELQRSLAGFGVMTWIDSCELRDGDRLDRLIQKAIEAASAFALVVSPIAFQSRWMGKELQHACVVQKVRGEKIYPVIPILIEGTQPSLLEGYLGEDSKYVSVPGDAGGVEAAVDEILVAIGLRPPADRRSQRPPQEPKLESLEDLTPHVTDLGIDENDGARESSARALMVELTAEMEKRFPGGRGEHVDSSVELCLHRLSPANQSKACVLSVFHGGVSLVVLHEMMKWGLQELDELAGELIATGLAKRNPYKHVNLHPALRPYLQARMNHTEREALQARWVQSMRGYVEFLVQLQSQHAEVAAKLTLLELPNLFALLALVQETQAAGAIIRLTTSLGSLLQHLGKPRLLECVAQARDSAAQILQSCSSASDCNACP
jgi:hypothetical protein